MKKNNFSKVDSQKYFANNHDYKSDVYENNFEMSIDKDFVDEFTYSIDEYFDKNKVNFLSEWFFDEKVHTYTGFAEKDFIFKLQIPSQYAFPDVNRRLNRAIEDFHIKEGVKRGTFEVFICEGSTSMLATIALFALQMGFKKIHSVFPLYFTIHKMCDVINLDIIPCNHDLTHGNNAQVDLPNYRSFLFITDPVWSTGRHHAKHIWRQIAEWQKKTGSTVFVDASFSYMDWGKSIKREPASILDPNLTLRLVCPTKALCLHGVRFSYLLCPKQFSKEIARISIVNTGSSCIYSQLLREKMFKKMTERKPNPVGLFASERFKILEKKLIENNIEYIRPECGFFMYANVDAVFRKKGIRQKYYWLKRQAIDILNPGYDGWAKINLISRKKTIDRLVKDLS